MINPNENLINRPIGNVIKLSTSLSRTKSSGSFAQTVPCCSACRSRSSSRDYKAKQLLRHSLAGFALAAAAAASSSLVAQILLLDLRKQIILAEEEDLARSLASSLRDAVLLHFVRINLLPKKKNWSSRKQPRIPWRWRPSMRYSFFLLFPSF